jgi:hypothetical protein
VENKVCCASTAFNYLVKINTLESRIDKLCKALEEIRYWSATKDEASEFAEKVLQELGGKDDN